MIGPMNWVVAKTERAWMSVFAGRDPKKYLEDYGSVLNSSYSYRWIIETLASILP